MATKPSPEEIALILERYSQPGQKIKATLEGVTPGFLMHSADAMDKVKDAAAKAKNKGSRSKYIPTPEVEAEFGAYRFDGKDSSLYLPTKNLIRTLVEAGKSFKAEKQRVSLKYAVAAGVTCPITAGIGFPLLNPESKKPITEYETDVRRVTVQKAAVMRARPLVPEWMAEVEFLLDTEALDMVLFASVLAYAGSRVGVGDDRPEKGGQHGRFKITEFTIIEEEEN